MPVGFREGEEGRAEAWLYEYCHKDYCITDEALTPGRGLECEGNLRNYMLCCMHILSAEPLILQAAGYPVQESRNAPSRAEVAAETATPTSSWVGCMGQG